MAGKTYLMATLVAKRETVPNGSTVLLIDILDPTSQPIPEDQIFQKPIYRGELNSRLELLLNDIPLSSTVTNDVTYHLTGGN